MENNICILLLNLLKSIIALIKEWSTVIVGLSAYWVYWMQKSDARKMAALSIVEQINSIEERIFAFKEASTKPGFGNTILYESSSIIIENMWEKHKHLLINYIDRSEYKDIQKFFDDAVQIERCRNDIILTLKNTWSSKSAISEETMAKICLGELANPKREQLNAFQGNDSSFTPKIVTDTFKRTLLLFNKLSGTTAYKQLNKLANKRIIRFIR